jgi:predicted RNase H-like nuclease (RuvC/YqgF family)
MTDAYALSYEGGNGPTVRACATINDPHSVLASTVVRGSWAGSSEEALKSLLRALVAETEAELAKMLEPLRQQLETLRYERGQLKEQCADLEVEVGALRQQLETPTAREPENDDLTAIALRRRNRELSVEVDWLRAKMSHVDKITNDLIDLVGDPGERT